MTMARWILLGLLSFLAIVWLLEWYDRRRQGRGPKSEE